VGPSPLHLRACGVKGHSPPPLQYERLLLTGIHPTRAAVCCFSSTIDATSKNDVSGRNRLFPEELNIIYDSKCNVCKLEIDFLRRRDLKKHQQHPKLRFTDIEDVSYNPKDAANCEISYERGMAAMHAVTADGKVIQGVPVFQMAYQKVGLGWLVAIAEVPFFRKWLDRAYDVFAKYRTKVTRGQSLESLVQVYREKKELEEHKESADCQTCRK
jgi:predicted DCC family thiol-disulfide oxidoreductase YuxK